MRSLASFAGLLPEIMLHILSFKVLSLWGLYAPYTPCYALRNAVRVCLDSNYISVNTTHTQVKLFYIIEYRNARALDIRARKNNYLNAAFTSAGPTASNSLPIIGKPNLITSLKEALPPNMSFNSTLLSLWLLAFNCLINAG